MRTGEPVQIRLKGRRRTADVHVLDDEAGVRAHYAIMVRDNPTFASFNRIRVGADGVADGRDLHQAWAGGARAIRLTPR